MGKAEVLKLILEDAAKGETKTIILRTFQLDAWPRHVVLQEPPDLARERCPTLMWPEIFQNDFKVYASLDALFRDRALFEGSILVVRLDRLGWEPTTTLGSNCRIVVTVINSSRFPTDALGLNYVARQTGDTWKVELVDID